MFFHNEQTKNSEGKFNQLLLTCPWARPAFPPPFPLSGSTAAANHFDAANPFFSTSAGTPAHTTALFEASSVLNTITEIFCESIKKI